MSQVPQTPPGQSGPVMPPGFFASLLDMGFTRFITQSVIKFLYWLIVILAGLGFLAYLFTAILTGSVPLILLALIIGPLVTVLYVIYARVGLEIIMIIFRMSDDVRAIREGGGFVAAQGGSSPSGVPAGYGYSQPATETQDTQGTQFEAGTPYSGPAPYQPPPTTYPPGGSYVPPSDDSDTDTSEF